MRDIQIGKAGIEQEIKLQYGLGRVGGRSKNDSNSPFQEESKSRYYTSAHTVTIDLRAALLQRRYIYVRGDLPLED